MYTEQSTHERKQELQGDEFYMRILMLPTKSKSRTTEVNIGLITTYPE